MLYYDYKTLFLKVVGQKMRLMKNRLKLNFTIYFEKAILKKKIKSINLPQKPDLNKNT